MTRRTGDAGVIDEIDRRILAILARDPRIPYSEISDALAEEGIEMSSEGIRRRVAALFEVTTSFFLLRPETYEWEIVLVAVRTANEPGAKATVFDAMADMNFWFVGGGFGTIDMYGIATVSSNAEVDDLVNEVRAHELVDSTEYFIETRRTADVEKYLKIA